MGKTPSRQQGRRAPRRKGRASSDAERRALAKANAVPARPSAPPSEGFAVLHADGGARGAPGPAAIGYVLDDAQGTRVAAHAEAIGVAAAAEAEYRALLAGLERALELGITRLSARSDSRLLIGHVKGERRMRSARLVALAAEIDDARMRVGTVLFEWVPAAANGDAHELVARVLASGD